MIDNAGTIQHAIQEWISTSNWRAERLLVDIDDRNDAMQYDAKFWLSIYNDAYGSSISFEEFSRLLVLL
jgi:hypothetical protein